MQSNREMKKEVQKINFLQLLTNNYFLTIERKRIEIFCSDDPDHPVSFFRKGFYSDILNYCLSRDIDQKVQNLTLFLKNSRVALFKLNYDNETSIMSVKYLRTISLKECYIKDRDESQIVFDFHNLCSSIVIDQYHLVCTFKGESVEERPVYYINLSESVNNQSNSDKKQTNKVELIYRTESKGILVSELKDSLAILDESKRKIIFIPYKKEKHLSDKHIFSLIFETDESIQTVDLNELANDPNFYDQYQEVYDKCKEDNNNYVYESSYGALLPLNSYSEDYLLLIEKNYNGGVILVSKNPPYMHSYIPSSKFNNLGEDKGDFKLNLIEKAEKDVESEECNPIGKRRVYSLSYSFMKDRFLKLIEFEIRDSEIEQQGKETQLNAKKSDNRINESIELLLKRWDENEQNVELASKKKSKKLILTVTGFAEVMQSKNNPCFITTQMEESILPFSFIPLEKEKDSDQREYILLNEMYLLYIESKKIKLRNPLTYKMIEEREKERKEGNIQKKAKQVKKRLRYIRKLLKINTKSAKNKLVYRGIEKKTHFAYLN